ncbi:MAG: hypothetical protein ACRDRH_23495 [Pseudonocardia sp.]
MTGPTPATGGMPPNVAQCIDVAAQFLAAQPGAVERALAKHRRGKDGRCTGCVHTQTRWPCAVASIGMRAAGKAR